MERAKSLTLIIAACVAKGMSARASAVGFCRIVSANVRVAEMTEGHPIADITLVQGETVKKLTDYEKLD